MSDELILRPDETIICPRGSGEGSPIIIDLKAIVKALARISEIQSVTPMKAPELLSDFTCTWRDLSQNITFLEKERNDAYRVVNKIRSIIMLDEVPEKLKARNLSNNEHHREAIIALDPRFEEADQRKDKIEAVIGIMRTQLKAIEMAYTSVKKIIGENAYNYMGGNSHRTSGDSGSTEPGELSPSERPSQYFGTPKY